MTALQRIDRVRRDYNKWVANQTLEDYALRFTAKKARRFSVATVGQTAIGAASFLALEAIGGSMTLHYGFTNALAAFLAMAIATFVAGIPICFYAAKYGLDIDLLTRGAGFGYIGSTITSLVYASFTFILFAIEASIMALALELCLGLPLPIGYFVSAVAVIPLVVHGVTAISRFQVWTQPVWITLNVLPVAAIALKAPHALADWRSFAGSASGSSKFQLLYFGEAASVALAFVVQLGEQVDFLRFLPQRKTHDPGWWLSLVLAGPGWVMVGALKLLAGSFLAVYLVRHGSAPASVDPPRMYAAAFSQVFDSPALALAATCALVATCQLKINVTNAYAGSIAWSNFFSRLTHHHPGRVVWLLFNVVLALLVMELGVYGALEQTLAFYSGVAVAWIGALLADLVVNKPLGLSPPGIEFKRAHLYDVNPVGTGAMILGASLAVSAQAGLMGMTCKALAPFLSFATAFLAAPAIAAATRGKYYLARRPEERTDTGSAHCCICQNAFETEDMAHCPAYAGAICSLCCTLDARCQDLCKPQATLHEQLKTAASRVLPEGARHRFGPLLVEFASVFIVSVMLAAAVLVLVALTLSSDARIPYAAAVTVFWKALLLISIVAGIVSWLIVLVKASGRAARSETQRQTRLLMDEIEAHERTDKALKKAKQAAEAANFAKSRYVVGLSHELRTPLNSISGYAQILERDEALPETARSRIAVMRRSAKHLSSLIDGLLDISKIEAGKLDLARDEVATRAFIDQLSDMFTVQAAAKGIRFALNVSSNLPPFVRTDEKRLRQILLNLLSNAVKFTTSGSVTFSVTYRNEVAVFTVEDTGPGIAAADIERVFQPFERLSSSAAEPGTGLGLTICRLLAGVMGGEIKVESEPGLGSLFRLRIFLPRIQGRENAVARHAVDAAFGLGFTVLVADDDPVHRDMIRDVLSSYGFAIVAAEDGVVAEELAARIDPDVFLLDIDMPRLDGWSLARRLNASGPDRGKIVMLSASAMEEHRQPLAEALHDVFMMKPTDVDVLVDTLAALLAPSMARSLATPGPASSGEDPVEPPPDAATIQALIEDAEIGYVRGLHDALDAIEARDATLGPFASNMRAILERMDMRALVGALERARGTPR